MATTSRADKASLKRDCIIDAAIVTFASQGFSATRIADIARKAEIGKGTVYEYFSTKEDLLLAACLRCCQRHATNLAQHAKAFSGQTSYVQMLGAMLHEVLVEGPQTRQQEARLFGNLAEIAPMHGFEKTARQEVIHLYAESERMIITLCSQGIVNHEFRQHDPEAFARLVTATLDGLIWQFGWRDDQEQAAKAIVRLLVDSLKNGSGAGSAAI